MGVSHHLINYAKREISSLFRWRVINKFFFLPDRNFSHIFFLEPK